MLIIKKYKKDIFDNHCIVIISIANIVLNINWYKKIQTYSGQKNIIQKFKSVFQENIFNLF